MCHAVSFSFNSKYHPLASCSRPDERMRPPVCLFFIVQFAVIVALRRKNVNTIFQSFVRRKAYAKHNWECLPTTWQVRSPSARAVTLVEGGRLMQSITSNAFRRLGRCAWGARAVTLLCVPDIPPGTTRWRKFPPPLPFLHSGNAMARK